MSIDIIENLFTFKGMESQNNTVTACTFITQKCLKVLLFFIFVCAHVNCS